MNKKKVFTIVIAIVLAVLFFPIPVTHSFSGTGEVLTLEKEPVGVCILDIEIKELSSLAVCYDRSFSFSIDGGSVKECEKTGYSETDDFCSLGSFYYDNIMDEMKFCGLVYGADLSYAIIRTESNFYYINNGAGIPYAELPVSYYHAP